MSNAPQYVNPYFVGQGLASASQQQMASQANQNLQSQLQNAAANYSQQPLQGGAFPWNQAVGAAHQFSPPPVMWEENVPADELAYEGILSRWPMINMLYPPNSQRQHDINCCQRMIML